MFCFMYQFHSYDKLSCQKFYSARWNHLWKWNSEIQEPTLVILNLGKNWNKMCQDWYFHIKQKWIWYVMYKLLTVLFRPQCVKCQHLPFQEISPTRRETQYMAVQGQLDFFVTSYLNFQAPRNLFLHDVSMMQKTGCHCKLKKNNV